MKESVLSLSFRKALFVVLFVPAVPLCLFFFLSFTIWRARTIELKPALAYNTTVVASDTGSALPPQVATGAKVSVQTADARAEIVARFLERHDSPLQPYDHYGRALVETADRYGLDYRLVPAIMMQESNLCKSIPPNSYNCLGFGIHSRGTLTFENYEASFDRAARELKERYVDIGLTTPEQIMKKYTPSSNGSWAFSVNQWIVEMEYNDRAYAQKNRKDNDLLEYVEK